MANYTTIYIGLPIDLRKKLRKLAQKSRVTESVVLRLMLDKYLEEPPSDVRPCEKKEILGMKVRSRTISKEHDRRLRELSSATGRDISEIIREAVGIY